MAIIRAAGGLLWRLGSDGRPRLAVVHRPRRKDWSLPKGKVEDGETWEEAALREVLEETGCTARIASLAGVVHRVPKRLAKVVLYWHMELVREGPLLTPDEVDEVAWLTRTEALRRLDYASERELLLEASGRFAPTVPARAGTVDEPQEPSELDLDELQPSGRGPVGRFLAAAIGVGVGAAIAGAGARELGPTGSVPVALAAAVLGSLAAAGAMAFTAAPRIRTATRRGRSRRRA
jgi:8-oxo-dGTP diphosphatase